MSVRRQGYTAGIAAVATLSLVGFAGLAGATGAAAATKHVRKAPVLGSAVNGGKVIVLLKNEHKGLSLRSAARFTAAHNDQKSVVKSIKAHGGTSIVSMVSVNGVGATVSKAEVKRLRTMSVVKQIIPDSTVTVSTGIVKRNTAHTAPPADLSSALCPSNPSDPLQEPEALADIHASAQDAPHAGNEGNTYATGVGVVVANDGINALAGNPNFTRPDGTHVVIDAPNYTADSSDGEYYGDASSIAAQGDVVYDFSKELPYSGLPVGCTFTLKGDAPGASLVDTTQIVTPPSSNGQILESEAQMVANIDHAVRTDHANIISESYGYSNTPGAYATHYAANDAAVAAGVTVVVSAGDSGSQGTVSSPATDPLVISAGATNTLRLNAQAYGYTSWTNDNVTPLSSGGTSPNNKLPDILAPGYGGEAACSPTGSDCESNTITEAFGGTSESAPLVAGAAADVIQAYEDSHGGTAPTPSLVKQILTGTATDVDAPADQGGSGLVNVYAAVRAAQQMPGTTVSNTVTTPAELVDTSGTQLDVTGASGATTNQPVTLFNASNKPQKVTGTFRTLGAYSQIGSTVTEAVSAPDPSLPIPAEGATAASPITFTVPAGLSRMETDMIWPDPLNDAILSYDLIDPNGALTQISYDYGTAGRTPTTIGSVPDIGHTEVADPVPGTWTVLIRWANGRSHLQEAPNVPGTYTGNLSFRVQGANWALNTNGNLPAATAAVTIPANSSATVTVPIRFAAAPGDHPQSVQFTSKSGEVFSLPIARRTLVDPTTGHGSFTSTIGPSVGRGLGGITTFDVNVPAGQTNLLARFSTPDASADNPMTFYLLNPSGTVVAEDSTPTKTLQGIGATTPTAAAAVSVINPVAGVWEIDEKLNLTTSGKEFNQVISGSVSLSADNAKVFNGLPTASTTNYTAGTSHTVNLRVTNNTGVGRSFTLTSSVSPTDLSGGAASTPIYLSAGASALVTTTIVAPAETANTVIAGNLNVISNTSTTARNLTTQLIAQFPYTYTSVPAAQSQVKKKVHRA